MLPSIKIIFNKITHRYHKNENYQNEHWCFIMISFAVKYIWLFSSIRFSSTLIINDAFPMSGPKLTPILCLQDNKDVHQLNCSEIQLDQGHSSPFSAYEPNFNCWSLINTRIQDICMIYDRTPSEIHSVQSKEISAPSHTTAEVRDMHNV